MSQDNPTQTFCDKAIEILQKTNDGNNLDPVDLDIVQATVNGHLTETGEIYFYDLHQRVIKGYKKPWFHGIEHLTIDWEGYVYWKNKHIEHFTLCWAYSKEAFKQAKELERRCKLLEYVCQNVNSLTVIWKWKD